MRTRKESDDVLYPDEEIVVVGQAEIAGLRDLAGRSSRARARLCTHHSTCDLLQEMFIVLTSTAYIRPHKHLGRAESFAVLEGEVDVILFDEAGGVRKVITLQEPGTGGNFYYRLPAPIYHTLLIRSARLVFHEVTQGPFQRADTHFAPWAPVEGDADGIRLFASRLEEILAASRRET